MMDGNYSLRTNQTEKVIAECFVCKKRDPKLVKDINGIVYVCESCEELDINLSWDGTPQREMRALVEETTSTPVCRICDNYGEFCECPDEIEINLETLIPERDK